MSRDDFSRRQSNQEIHFLAASYLFLFYFTFFPFRESFVLAISELQQFKQLFLKAVQRDKCSLWWTVILWVVIPCVLFLKVLIEFCECQAVGQDVGASEQHRRLGFTLCFYQQHYWHTTCSQWFVLCGLWMKCCWWKGTRRTQRSCAPLLGFQSFSRIKCTCIIRT